MMKCYLLLLLLLPICTAQKHQISCIGHDFLMVQNMPLNCKSKVQQACYTRDSGEKGCTTLDNCSKTGWNCCYTNNCNA